VPVVSHWAWPGRVRARGRATVTAGKRCSNALLRASGFSLLYPGYREGYRGALSDIESCGRNEA
jgi:hypothetical protein